MAETRRSLLKKGLVGAGVLALGGGGLALRRTKLAATTPALKYFTPAEYAVWAAVAERFLPGGAGWPSASTVGVASAVDGVLTLADPQTQGDLHQLLGLFDSALASLLFDGRPTPFTQLGTEAQDAALEAWRTSRLVVRRSGYEAMRRLSMAVYYARPESWAGVGYPGPPVLAQ